MFLKESAEGKGGGKNSIRRPKRQKSIRVDGLESDIDLPCRRLDGTRKKETGVIIRDDDGRFRSQLGQQAFAGSGFRFEREAARKVKKYVRPFSDDISVDKLGSVIFRRKGRSECPRILIAAHMDEVVLMVSFIAKDGFLPFHTWGITSNIMLGQRILLRGSKGYLKGVVGTKPPHIMTQEERTKIIPTENLFIDIGAESLEEAEGKGVEIGTTGVFDVEFTELGGGYLRGKAFDDRTGCMVLEEVFKTRFDNRIRYVVKSGSEQRQRFSIGKIIRSLLDPFGIP